MSRRRVQFLRTLSQAGGKIERIIPRDHPRNVRENIVAFRGAISLTPRDDTLTRWLRWQSEQNSARKGLR